MSSKQEGGKPADGLGVAGVVLGILSALVCWIPVLNIVVIPVVVIGGVLSLVGLFVALGNSRSGAGWPFMGLGLNIFAFVVMLVVNAAFASTVATAAKQAADDAERARLVTPDRSIPGVAPVRPAIARSESLPQPSVKPGSRKASEFPEGSRVTIARPGGSGHAHVSTDREPFEENLTATFGQF
jgi:hypothetical protein